MIKIFLLLLVSIQLHALLVVDISTQKRVSILEHSDVYFDDNLEDIEEIVEANRFQPYDKPQLNRGLSKKTIWIKFKIKNSTDLPIDKVLVLSSTLLEHIALYNRNNLDRPRLKGVSHLTKEHFTLYPFYHIRLEAGQIKEYYLEIKSIWTPIDFSIEILDKNRYLLEDRQQQLIKVMLLSMIAILMLYSLIISIYMRDKGYLFYSFYLLTLIYQQGSYLGLHQIYLPLDFIVNIEIRMAINKVALMIISASLFAIFFLKTVNIPILHRIYKIFIAVAIVEIAVLNIPQFYNLGIVIVTSFLLILFNIIASIISYQKGNKQARLFILGFSIVFFSYVLIMANALGLISIMRYIPNTLIWGTTAEALILSLAFADRYMILQAEKAKADRDREQIIKDEVIEKTAQLNLALKAKELILKEVHHRVKNNLQIILSMIRLQNDKITDESVSDKFVNLENRINAIAKTYNMLLIDDNLDDIDMEEYINSLLGDIAESMCDMYCDIEIQTDVNASLPLGKSVYIGIIINELVTNAYKYAFEDNEGLISVYLYKELGVYTLIIRDNGSGFVYDKQSKSLGLTLIHALVTEQLEGEIEMSTEGSTQYTIRFKS